MLSNFLVCSCQWGLRGGSSVCRPGSEDPHRRQRKFISNFQLWFGVFIFKYLNSRDRTLLRPISHLHNLFSKLWTTTFLEKHSASLPLMPNHHIMIQVSITETWRMFLNIVFPFMITRYMVFKMFATQLFFCTNLTYTSIPITMRKCVVANDDFVLLFFATNVTMVIHFFIHISLGFQQKTTHTD